LGWFWETAESDWDVTDSDDEAHPLTCSTSILNDKQREDIQRKTTGDHRLGFRSLGPFMGLGLVVLWKGIIPPPIDPYKTFRSSRR
jgi:hypothetical protein